MVGSMATSLCPNGRAAKHRFPSSQEPSSCSQQKNLLYCRLRIFSAGYWQGEFLLGKPHLWKARSNNSLGECYLGPRQGVFLTILYSACMCVYVSWSEPASQHKLIVAAPASRCSTKTMRTHFRCYYRTSESLPLLFHFCTKN